ncbi:MAG: YaaR family protein [Syntrophomonadaceae bacterium]
MKIDRERDKTNKFFTPGKVDLQGVKKVASSSFEQEFIRRRYLESQQRMQEMLKEIDRLNQKLTKSLTIDDLMGYKKMVKLFLSEAISSAYSIKMERGRNRRGRSILITVKTIDKEVEQLVQDFINKCKKPVEVLASLDKIRGMLVDLMI